MGRDDAAPTNPPDFTTNLDRLITQMLATAQTIAKPTVGASIGAGTNTGTGFLMGTTAQGACVDPNDGLAYDYLFAEVLTYTCSDDAYAGGGASVSQEPFAVVGYPASADQLNYAWPAGSGTQTSISTASPDSTTDNLALNGNFNSWGTPVSNTPDSWTISVGTPGTTIKRDTSPLRSVNTYSLQFVGNGSELTTIRQAVTLAPNTTYAVNCWVKTDGAVAAGVLRIRLMDGSSTINDAAGTANSVTRNASAMTSSYVALNAFFRTPKVLPATVYLEIGLSTAVTNTEILDVTDLFFGLADQAYVGGAFSKVIPGETPFAKGDTLSQTTTNNATNSQFCRLLDRFFSLRTNGKRIPSVGGAAETVSDSLIA
jgi:hypothetical protein